jgi:iron complex outermembrane receptor protein
MGRRIRAHDRLSLTRLGALASIPALAFSATAAFAQEDSGQLEEVTITAEFREANLQETPIAITAVTAEMLEARSQNSVEQIAAQAPSVHLGPQGQANGSGLIAFIRGVGQTDFNFALEPGVGLYIDDVYYPTLTGSLVDLLDLDRVEVLRGPQGTLAGRNSIGGAIKLFSKKPVGEGGAVSVTFGNYARVDVRATGDFTILPDKLFIRVAGVSKNRDGYVDRVDYACTHPNSGLPQLHVGTGCKLGTLGGVAYNAGRMSLRWLPSDAVEVNLIGDLTNDNSEAGADVLRRASQGDGIPTGADGVTSWNIGLDDGNPATPVVTYDCRFVPYGPNSCDPNQPNDPYLSYANFLDPGGLITNAGSPLPFKPAFVPPVQQLDQYGVSASVDVKLSDSYSLKSITAWRRYDSSWAQDVDGSPLPSQQLLQTLKHWQWSQELRLNGTTFGDKLDYTLGAFYFEQGGTLEARVDLNYAHIDFIHGPDTTPSKSQAAFVHGAYHLTDRTNLSAGVRFSKDEKEYTYFRRNPDGSLPSCNFPFTAGPFGPDQPTNCALGGLFNISDSFEGDRTDWRVALDYKLTDDLMTYGQISTGYKGGGVNPRPFFGPTGPPGSNQLKSFDPETLTTYELGFKADLLGNRMRLNTAVFYNDYQDIILTLNQCPGPPCLQPNNVGEAEVKGLEVETEFHVTDNWLIDASASYLDFEYTSVNTALTAVTPDMVTPFTPEFKGSIGLQYSREVGSMGRFIARLDANYMDEVYGLPINEPTNLLPSYTIANARFSWRSTDDNWDTSIEVTNITDEVYGVFVFDQAHSSGTTTHTPGFPRAYALTVKRNF